MKIWADNGGVGGHSMQQIKKAFKSGLWQARGGKDGLSGDACPRSEHCYVAGMEERVW